ncbi:hypothetical protein SCP_0301480 [Sparassis crispa]|uniref:F-box domain-containing protein n=1 Tax=Sparassis crispa TaxID=139825 RepID=A0A401GE97_9APHY|nr:hypothetical protein SCP_0301480 [Sparassis crispa]GBE80433.1 hypothetical protein SCP_0301480 [Sparassis crispa]
MRQDATLSSKRFHNLGVPFLFSLSIIRDSSIHKPAATFCEPLSSLTRVMSTFRVFPELANNLKNVSPLVSLSQRLREHMMDILVPPHSFDPFPNLRTLSLSRGWTKFTSNDIAYDALPRLKALKMVDCETPRD